MRTTCADTRWCASCHKKGDVLASAAGFRWRCTTPEKQSKLPTHARRSQNLFHCFSTNNEFLRFHLVLSLQKKSTKLVSPRRRPPPPSSTPAYHKPRDMLHNLNHAMISSQTQPKMRITLTITYHKFEPLGHVWTLCYVGTSWKLDMHQLVDTWCPIHWQAPASSRCKLHVWLHRMQIPCQWGHWVALTNEH